MTDQGKGSGNRLIVIGFAGLAALCCAGPLVLGTLGVGAIAAALTRWSLLIPFILAAVGIVARYAWRRSCRIRAATAEDPQSRPATRSRS